MLPLLIIIPVGLLLWKLGKDAGVREMTEPQARQLASNDIVVRAVEDVLARRGHAPPSPVAAPLNVPLLPPTSPYELGSVAQYLDHLRECMTAAAALNTIRAAAIAADMNGLMNAPNEAVFALAVLSQPMDTLTVQRDLNILGANPPLAESGVRDAQTIEAIKGLQERFKQPLTGVVDPGTAVAIRYSVGVVHAQNQMGAMGG